MKSVRNIFDYLIIGFVVLSSGLATKLFRGFEISIFLCFISLGYLLVRRQLFNRRYLVACTVWLAYALLSFLKIQSGNPFWSFSIFCSLTVSFALIERFGYGLAERYSVVIYFFALWSLVLFAWQLLSLDSMLYVWSAFDMSDKLYDKPYTYYAHAFFYTIHQFIDTAKGSVRNAGFCWEPGAFSCFLVLAIYVQLLRDSYRLSSHKKRYLVLFLALLTTQSTTGLLGLAVIFIDYILNVQKGGLNKYVVPLVLMLIPAVLMLPDQVQKVKGQASDNFFDEVYLKESSDDEKGLGRFQSAVILAIDFSGNPVLGIGSDRAETWVSKMGLSVNPTSGIGNMLATYGLFIMLPYFYFLRKSSAMMSRYYGVSGGGALFYIFIVLGFAFSVLETPVFASIALMALFERRRFLTR